MLNFILINYSKEELIGPKNRNFSKEEYNFYIKSQNILFEIMKKQIEYFHKEFHIHILTNNKNNKDNNNTTYHYLDFKSNHTSKFLIYNLIKEPAIYVDCDIILFKPFQKELINNNERINLFTISRKINLQSISRNKLPIYINNLYNAGIVFINKPGQDIVDNLIDINNKYFSDVKYIISKNEWPYNDEYALSLYVNLNKIKIKLNNNINVPRWSYNNKMNDIQSLHYTGIKAKKLLSIEYTNFPIFSSIVKSLDIKEDFFLDVNSC